MIYSHSERKSAQKEGGVSNIVITGRQGPVRKMESTAESTLEFSSLAYHRSVWF